MKVRCNNCLEIFDEEDIKISNDKNYFFEQEICPKCGKGQGLMDMPRPKRVFSKDEKETIEALKKEYIETTNSMDNECYSYKDIIRNGKAEEDLKEFGIVIIIKKTYSFKQEEE